MKVKNYKEFNDNAEITFSLGEEEFKVKIPIDNKTKEELISDARTAINNNLLKRQNETMQPIVYKEDNNFIKKQFIEIDLDSLEPVNLTFPLKQGDRYSHEITVIPNDSKFNYQIGIVHYSDGNYQIIDNSFTFRIPPNVLEFEGEMELEIEFQLEDLIRKSNRIGFVVLESLNSTDEIEFEDLTPIQDLLNDLGKLIIDNEEINLEIIKTKNSIENLHKDINQNESIRLENEQYRINNESDRSNKEIIRRRNEEERLNSEKIREKNENERISIFSTKINSIKSLEEDLSKNELIRKNNEKERINAEANRFSNEKLRKDNENIREKNESIRVANEEVRLKQLEKIQQWIDNPNILRGPKGEKGDPGTGINIIGTCESQENLPDPKDSKAGDGYLINGDLYVLTDEYEFVNVGRIQGPKGEPGKSIKYISELINDEGFITLEDIPEFDLSEIDSKICKINISLNDVKNNISEIDKTKANSDHKHSNYLEEVNWTDIKNIPNTFNPSSHTHKSIDIKEVEDKFFINKAQIEKINTIDDKADDNDVVKSINGKKGDITIESNGSRSSTIVIANYDSHKNSKDGADIIIEKGENAAKKINEAIQSLEGIGGEVKLMEGNYNLEYGIAVSVDGVHLTGIPKATILVQNSGWKDNPYANNRKHIVDTWRKSNLEGVNVEISNLYVKGANISGSGGFSCRGSSKVTNCISENSGSDGFSCWGSSKVTNCISENSGSDGFSCWGSSKVTNCISENSGSGGFSCWGSSKVTNCISENSDGYGFWCIDSSKVTNCISKNSGSYGFSCGGSFKGVCGHNTLIGDTLNDSSSSPAVVQYNIIQEEV